MPIKFDCCQHCACVFGTTAYLTPRSDETDDLCQHCADRVIPITEAHMAKLCTIAEIAEQKAYSATEITAILKLVSDDTGFALHSIREVFAYAVDGGPIPPNFYICAGSK